MLAAALGVPHISTGEMLREAVAAGTGLGKQAEAIMTAGDLVPDALVVAIVEERLARPDAACGYLLDGFPRNITQAEALTAAVGADAIEVTILLEADEEEIVTRLLKRAAELGRSDDNEATIRRRLDVYREETQPLVAYYADTIVEVDGLGTVEAVFARIALSLATAAA